MIKINNLQKKVAARRVAPFSHDSKGLGCPTEIKPPIETKGKYRPASNEKSAHLLSRFMTDEHKRMSRMLGYTLHIGTPEAWQGFRHVAQVRMTEAERAMLAFFMLNSLSEENVEMAAASVFGRMGAPIPAFLGDMDEARSWSAFASRNELKSYALAAFEAMSPKDQAAFFQHIRTFEVAL